MVKVFVLFLFLFFVFFCLASAYRLGVARINL